VSYSVSSSGSTLYINYLKRKDGKVYFYEKIIKTITLSVNVLKKFISILLIIERISVAIKFH
jgi:hypothetical protein